MSPFLIASLINFSINWNSWSNATNTYFWRSHAVCQPVPHLSLLVGLNNLSETRCTLIYFCVRTRTGGVISEKEEPADANGKKSSDADMVLISNPREFLVGQNGWTKAMRDHVGHYARAFTDRDRTVIRIFYCLGNCIDKMQVCDKERLFDVCSEAVLRIPQGTMHAQRLY